MMLQFISLLLSSHPTSKLSVLYLFALIFIIIRVGLVKCLNIKLKFKPNECVPPQNFRLQYFFPVKFSRNLSMTILE